MKNKIIYIEDDKDDFLALKNVLKSTLNDTDLVWVNSLQSLLELKVDAQKTLFVMLDYQFEELNAKNLIHYFKEIAFDIEIVILTKYQEDKIYNTFKKLGINHIFNKNEMENLLQFVLEKKHLLKSETLVNKNTTVFQENIQENFKPIEYYNELIPNNCLEELNININAQLLLNQNFQILAFNQKANYLFENNLKNGENFLTIINSKYALLIADKIKNFNNDSISFPCVIKNLMYELHIKLIKNKSQEKIFTIYLLKNISSTQTESIYINPLKNSQLLIENSKSIIFQLNNKGEVIYLSDSYKNITGFEKEDVMYKPLGIKQSNDVQEKVKYLFNKLSKGEITETTDYITTITKDKNTVYLRYRAESIIDEHGNFNGVYGVFTDVTEVIEVSEALKSVKDSSKLIFENINEVIFILDNKTRITLISPSVLEVTGYSQEDVIGKRFIDFIHPDDYVYLNKFMKQRLPGNNLNEKFENIVTRFKKKNDSYIYIETNIKKIKNKKSEDINYIGSSRNVDEKITADIQLIERKKYLEIVTEIQNFYILTKDKKKTFDHLLKRILAQTNIDYGFVSLVFTDKNGNPYIQSNEFTTITFNQTFDSSDKIDEIIVDELKNIQTLIERVLNEKQLIKWNNIVIDTLIDGIPITQKLIAIPIYSNNKILAVLGFSSKQEEYATSLMEKLQPIIVVLVSIIEQNRRELKIKKAQQELVKSEAKVKAILTTIDDIILEINHEHIILNVWTKNSENIGFPIEQLIHKNLSEFINHFPFNQSIYDNLLLLSQDGIPRKIEYSTNVNDEILWKKANLYLLVKEPEKIYCLQISDITAFKNAEANLKQNLIHEKELADLKSRFVTLTSHEFRTPLTSISSSNELVSMLLKKSGIPINDQLENYINNIQNQVKHMIDLVNDVIKIGKIDANKMVLNLDDLNLKEAIVEIMENLLFTHKIPKKIKTIVKGEPYNIKMDIKALEHIIENIANNAFKYSPNRPDPILEIDFQSSQIILALQDFGIGIPKQDQPLLFEHFYRASNVGKIEGVGLGLVIVKNLVNQLQGNLKIESEEDKGTRLEITFKKNNLD